MHIWMSAAKKHQNNAGGATIRDA